MNKKNSKIFILVMAGILTGFAPLTTDMYLPSFPELTEFFNTSVSLIQMSLMSAMIGIALGPLFVGPVSDKYGRNKPLLISLVLFCIVTFCSVFIDDIFVFILFRFLQGLAASSGMVLSRAILTDSFTGMDLKKSLSVNTAIFGFTPATAPILGGVLLTVTDWKGIFVFLLVFGVLVLISSLGLKETLPQKKRHDVSEGKLLNGYTALFKNKAYLKYAAIFTFSFAITFSYIAASPFIFQSHFHLSPLIYSILYGTSTLASALGSLSVSRYSDQFKALRIGTMGAFITMLVSASLLIGNAHVAVFQGSLFILFFFNGMTFPASTCLALELTRKNAGTASAVLGSASFVLGGIISPLVGIGNVVYGASIAMMCSAFVSMLLCWFAFRDADEKTGIINMTDDMETHEI